mgnify:CR=1 FL=1
MARVPEVSNESKRAKYLAALLMSPKMYLFLTGVHGKSFKETVLLGEAKV